MFLTTVSILPLILFFKSLDHSPTRHIASKACLKQLRNPLGCNSAVTLIQWYLYERSVVKAHLHSTARLFLAYSYIYHYNMKSRCNKARYTVRVHIHRHLNNAWICYRHHRKLNIHSTWSKDYWGYCNIQMWMPSLKQIQANNFYLKLQYDCLW